MSRSTYILLAVLSNGIAAAVYAWSASSGPYEARFVGIGLNALSVAFMVPALLRPSRRNSVPQQTQT